MNISSYFGESVLLVMFVNILVFAYRFKYFVVRDRQQDDIRENDGDEEEREILEGIVEVTKEAVEFAGTEKEEKRKQRNEQNICDREHV